MGHYLITLFSTADIAPMDLLLYSPGEHTPINPGIRGDRLKTKDGPRLIAPRIVNSCFPGRLEIPAHGRTALVNCALYSLARCPIKCNAALIMRAGVAHGPAKSIHLHR